MLEIPVKDLQLQELQRLQIHHPSGNNRLFTGQYSQYSPHKGHNVVIIMSHGVGTVSVAVFGLYCLYSLSAELHLPVDLSI